MTRTVLALLASLLANPAAAQGAGAERGRTGTPPGLIVVLRDPQGNAVEGAHGRLRCPPASALEALQDLPAARFAALGETAEVTGSSDKGGMLRFVTEAPRAGSGLVSTDAGLGALIPRLRPGSTPRLVMQPMARLFARDEEEFSLWARSISAATEPVAVAFGQVRGARLPPGEYEIWARRGDEWSWQRLALGSGQRVELAFDGERQRVASRDGAWIHAANWPEVALVEPHGEAVFLGSIPIAVSAGVPGTGAVVADRSLPRLAANAPLPWPPPVEGAPLEFRLADAVPATDRAELFVVQRSDSGTWRVFGASHADERRRFRVPPPPDGDTWLLLVVAGHAPLARPFAAARTDEPLAPSRGHPLVVRAVDERGDPIADLAVEWQPHGGDAALVRAHTDARGIADLGRATAPGTLLASDARYRNERLELDAVPTAPVALSLATGESIDGVARFPDGTPATGAAITLRDPTTRLRPASRAAAVGADGSFSFGGLPEEREFVLFATMTRDGRTWSGRLGTVRAGRSGVELVLRDEDPAPFRR